MVEAFELASQYGPVGILLFVMAGLIIVHEKKEGRIVKNLKKNFDRIEALEKNDVESDGRFNNIDTKLEHLDEKIDTIGVGVNTIINNFAAQGMKK